MNPTEYLASLGCDMNADLTHYGTKRHSGRYPWGSGERPYQGEPRQGGEYKLKKTRGKLAYMALEDLNMIKYGIISRVFPPYAVGQLVTVIRSRKEPERESTNIKKIKDLPRKSKQTTIKEDLKAVNPSFLKTEGVCNNCSDTVIAMEMRRRGYDVRAIRNKMGEPISITDDIFIGSKKEYPFRNSEKKDGESEKQFANRIYNELCNKLESYGDGARGAIGITFKGFVNAGMGHSLYWEVSDGKVSIYDTQSGGNKKILIDDLSIADPTLYNFARFDNCKISNKVTDYVTVNKKKGG